MVSYRNGVSIGEIAFYVPALIIAVILAIVHGFGRNSGWFFLITFSLARIVGPCFQLATIHDPTNTDLYTGAAILQSIGLSPLMLTALGLLSRVVSSISKTRRTFPGTRQLLLIHLVVTGALVLGVIGGIKSSDKLKSTGSYVPQTYSKIASALFILSYILIVLSVLFTFCHISHAERGERRILVAVALSLPFLLVRVVYSSLSVYDTSSKTFNVVDGNVTVWLVMALIMEAIIVIIYETVGLTLRKVEKADAMAPPATQPQVQPYASPAQMEAQQPYGQPASGQSAYGGGGPKRGFRGFGRRGPIRSLISAMMGSRDEQT